jgi:glycosyltransferase involved in cell wall biosynthesis
MAPHRFSGRIVFLNRFFHPDHSATSDLLSDLAFALARRGFRVTVITSRQRYETATASLPPRERVNGVDILRVWTSKRGRARLMGRSLDYFTFYLTAGLWVWRLARANDIIVAKTDPPLLSVAIAPVARLRRAHVVNWLQDIFPEVGEALDVGGGLGRLAFRMLRPLRNWSLRSAETNVVVGKNMAEHLHELRIPPERIRVIPNWSDGTLIAPLLGPNELRDQWVPKGCFVVGYAGNLGRAHDFTAIVEAMTLLNDRATNSSTHDIARQILFVFIGGGAQRAPLEREVFERLLANVRFRPYQPRGRLAETLGVADVHLVSLKPELEGLVVPSKFYGVAAAGRPTLFIGAADGEIGRLIREFECGFTVAPGDGAVLVERILQLANDPRLCATMGARARAAFETHWNEHRAVDRWEEVLSATSRPENRSAHKVATDHG